MGPGSQSGQTCAGSGDRLSCPSLWQKARLIVRQCLRRHYRFPRFPGFGLNNPTIGPFNGFDSNVLNLLFGRPLATSEERAEHIGPIAGIPIFGLDALSSAAYGPEAALTLLIPLGLLGVHYIVPVSAAIVILLTIVYFSYRQTIDAYPHGGGSYTVASQNLGEGAGLLAAAALMIDYILTAAVGISAGVGALISAVPSLQPHSLHSACWCWASSPS